MIFLQSNRGCLSSPRELLSRKSVYLHHCPLFEPPFWQLSRLFMKLSNCPRKGTPKLSELPRSTTAVWTVASIVPWCFIDSLSSRFLILITPPSCWSISTSRWSKSSERDIVPSSLLSTSANQRANFTIAKSQFDHLPRGLRTKLVNGRHDKAHPNFKKQHFWNIY